MKGTTMALFKRKAEYSIGPLTVTVDAEDVTRLESHQWMLAETDQNQLLPYADVGTPGDPVFLPLPNFLLSVGNDVYVERVNRSGADYTKKNLKASR
jgi:hypothetical protein